MQDTKKRPAVPPVEADEVAPDAPAALAIRALLAEGLVALREHESGADRGDVEGVHKLRATTRRLRTTLDLAEGLVDPDRAGWLEAELKWLADRLGAVRDLDVLSARLREAARAGGWDEALAPLQDAFEGRRAEALKALRQALGSERFATLKAGLADATAAPTEFGEPCRTSLPARVIGVWNKLRKRGRALSEDDPDADFHEVRKKAKHARYAAEAVAGYLDRGAASDASRFARRARRVQEILGVHQDAVIALAEIRKAAAEHPDLGPFNFAAGQLAEREQRAADASRAAFFDAWRALDRKKRLRWLAP